MEYPQKAMEYINPAERLRKGVAGFVDTLVRTPEEAVGKIASFEEGGTFGAGKKLGGVANAVFSSVVDAPATVGAMVANAQNYGRAGCLRIWTKWCRLAATVTTKSYSRQTPQRSGWKKTNPKKRTNISWRGFLPVRQTLPAAVLSAKVPAWRPKLCGPVLSEE